MISRKQGEANFVFTVYIVTFFRTQQSMINDFAKALFQWFPDVCNGGLWLEESRTVTSMG